jgi:hypothetical protein
MSAAITTMRPSYSPGTDGALFLLKNSSTGLQAAASWGEFPQDETASKAMMLGLSWAGFTSLQT